MFVVAMGCVCCFVGFGVIMGYGCGYVGGGLIFFSCHGMWLPHRGCCWGSGGGGGCAWLKGFCGGYFLFYFNEFFILF